MKGFRVLLISFLLMTTVLAGCTESVVDEGSGDAWLEFDNRDSIRGEVYTVGDVLTIEWSTSETGVDIYYEVDDGGYKVISRGVRNGAGGSGSYLWTVPNEPSQEVEIMISADCSTIGLCNLGSVTGFFSIVSADETGNNDNGGENTSSESNENDFKDLKTTEDYQDALDYLLSSCSSGFVDFTYSSMVVQFSALSDGTEYMINVPDHSDEVENFHSLMDEKTNLTKNDQYGSWERYYYTDDTSVGANDMDVIFREVFDLEQVGIDATFYDC